MRDPRAARRILACALLAAPLCLGGGMGQGAAPPASPTGASPSAAPPAADAKGAPIFVTMPENEAAAKRKASKRAESMTAAINREIHARNTPVTIGILTAVIALIFAIVVLLALRRRAKICPRCFSLLYEL